MSDSHTRSAWRAFVGDPTAENALRWAVLEARNRETLNSPAGVLNSPIREHEKVWNKFAASACGRMERGLASLLRIARSGKMRWKGETPVPELETWPELREEHADLLDVTTTPLLVRHLVLAGPERLRSTRECGDLTVFAAAAGLEALGIVDGAWTAHLVGCQVVKANKHLGQRHIAARQEAVEAADQRERKGGNYPLDGGVTVS